MNPVFIVVDLFCGAGGTTTGFVQAALGGEQVAKVVACINHDHTAILSHWANHPEVKHFEEDIRRLDLSELVAHVKYYRKLYPDAYLILWASLECTNFSKAKGGLARDADSRTLAHTLNMRWNSDANEYENGDSYIQLLDPDYIWIENVTEFKDWGPLRIKLRDGKPVMIKNKHGEIVPGYEPIPEFKGRDFKKWVYDISSLGYENDWTEINSADYGAHTSRTRLFGMFSKYGLPAVWPEPTHSKKGDAGLLKWNAVKEKIDFSDEGYSIFYRGRNQDIPKRQRKDLSDNTLERVYSGCIKHIAGGKKAFMVKYHGGNRMLRTKDLDSPLGVIDTQNRHAFVSIYHGNGDNTHSVESPSPTLTAADIQAIVFLNRDFITPTSSSIEQPAGSITTVPKMNIVKAEFAFVDTGQYTNTPSSVFEPLTTITANRKRHSLLTLQYGGQMQGVERPCPTILATSNKSPIYLVVTETGDLAIEVYESDSDVVKRLKTFMALYGITDIKMRMLTVNELLQIQGFPKKYRLTGSQENQKKFFGNSVVPHVVKAWCEAMAMNITEKQKKTA